LGWRRGESKKRDWRAACLGEEKGGELEGIGGREGRELEEELG